MASELSVPQREALRELVADGTLSAEQAAAVRARLESVAEPGREAASRWLVETAGYLGGALMFAGAGLLVGVSWDQLSRPGRVALLGAATVLLAGAGALIAGGRRGLRTMAAGPSTVRRRVLSVLWALATGTGALTAAVAVTDHQVLVGGAVGLLLAALAYLLLPSVPVLLAAVGFSALTGGAAADELFADTSLAIGLALTAVGAAWAVLGLLGVIRHRVAAVAAGAATALLGAQLPIGQHPGWAYLLTLLVAAGCLAAYALDRSVLLLALGVVATTVVVSESIADWTSGAVGGAIVVLAAGAVLVIGSLLALRLHRRRHP